MKKIISSLLALLLITNITYAQQEVNGSFDKIQISGSAKVYVRQSPQSSVTITGKYELGGLSIANNKLHISSVFSDPIYVTTPLLTKVSISGNGEIIMDSLFTFDKLTFDVSGNGKSNLALKGGIIKLDVSGNFTGDMKGTADKLELEVSGRANLYATELSVKSCDVDVSGMSKIFVDVKDSLNTRISGKGTVVYKTPPTYLNTENSGLAKMGDSNSSVNDTTKINFGKTKVLIIGDGGNYEWKSIDGPRKSYLHWAGLEFGYNNYLNSDNKFEVPDQYGYLKLRTGKAVFFNLNLFDIKFNLIEEYLMIGTGLGFSFRNYYFSTQDSILVPNASAVTAAPATQPWFKNKLAVDYLTVPLMLEYNTSKYNKNSFHIGAGMVFNLKMGSRVKTKSNDVKAKAYNDFNVRTVEWDARAQIGFGVLNLFATYSLNSLFKDNQGPELKPMTFGIALAGW